MVAKEVENLRGFEPTSSHFPGQSPKPLKYSRLGAFLVEAEENNKQEGICFYSLAVGALLQREREVLVSCLPCQPYFCFSSQLLCNVKHKQCWEEARRIPSG